MPSVKRVNSKWNFKKNSNSGDSKYSRIPLQLEAGMLFHGKKWIVRLRLSASRSPLRTSFWTSLDVRHPPVVVLRPQRSPTPCALDSFSGSRKKTKRKQQGTKCYYSMRQRDDDGHFGGGGGRGETELGTPLAKPWPGYRRLSSLI